jgi:hypothetical protein
MQFLVSATKNATSDANTFFMLVKKVLNYLCSSKHQICGSQKKKKTFSKTFFLKKFFSLEVKKNFALLRSRIISKENIIAAIVQL